MFPLAPLGRQSVPGEGVADIAALVLLRTRTSFAVGAGPTPSGPLLLDLDLPDTDDLDVCRAIHRLDELVVSVKLTGPSLELDIVPSADTSAQDHMTKLIKLQHPRSRSRTAPPAHGGGHLGHFETRGRDTHHGSVPSQP